MSIVPPQQLPQFFSEVVPLDVAAHDGLKLDRNAGYSFASGAVAILIGLGEFESITIDYPIVFTGNGDPLPVALVGCRAGENLFVRPDGGWASGVYIPAYVRTFPFILLENPSSHELFLGMQRGAKQLTHAQGLPLFDAGKPSQHLNEMMSLCVAYRQSLHAAREFGKTLSAEGLLQDRQAEFNFDRGEKARLDGFRIIDKAKFDALPAEKLLDWRAKGWLDAVYAHLHSSGRWRLILERAAAAHHSVQ